MNINEMSIDELKVAAYDESAILQVTQNNLKLINQRIAQLQAIAVDPEVVE